MYPNKKVGIMHSVMSALSFLVVRGRPAAVRGIRTASGPDSGARAPSTSAQVRKERYFEMARHSRWTQ
ncbi:MAG TPA: hypothetical protein VEY12_01500 [Thermoplasmata archaeon]|nr:hypothetical protein [Thermoplasmata archaeon]